MKITRVRELSNTKLKSVPCKQCGARRGQPCRSPDGRSRSIHDARKLEFLQTTPEGRRLLTDEQELGLGVRKKTPEEVAVGRAQVRTVECPECGAAPGDACISFRTARPRPMQSHRARVDAYGYAVLKGADKASSEPVEAPEPLNHERDPSPTSSHGSERPFTAPI